MNAAEKNGVVRNTKAQEGSTLAKKNRAKKLEHKKKKGFVELHQNLTVNFSILMHQSQVFDSNESVFEMKIFKENLIYFFARNQFFA